MKTYIQICLIFVAQCVNGQNQWLNFTNNYTVTDVVEVKNGLFISSTGGLCIYDSISQMAEYYNRGNSNLPSNRITDMIEVGDSSIWITTDQGLCTYSDGIITRGPTGIKGIIKLSPNGKLVVADHDSLYVQESGFIFNKLNYPNFVADISGVEVDSANNIYVNVINYFGETYIGKWDGIQWTIVFSDFIYESSITMDSQSRLWFLSSLGLKYFSNDIENHVFDIDTLDGFSVGRIFVNASDEIIFEDNNKQRNLWRYNGAQLDRLDYVKNQREDCYIVQPSSHDSDLYYCYNHIFGLYDSDGSVTSDYSPLSQSPLPYNNIISVLHSSDHLHYVIGYDSIQVIRNGVWSGIDLPMDFTGQISQTKIDSQDELFISNGQVIWYRRSGQWLKLSLPGEINEDIALMEIGENSDVWIQSGLNLARYRNQSWEVFRSIHHKITASSIKDLAIDPESNDLWVSSFQGIHHFNGSIWTQYDVATVNHAFGLAAAEGGVYIRTSGLRFFKDGILSTIPMPSLGYYGTFESKMVYDSEREVLYMTGSNALAALSNDQWTVYDTENSGIYDGYSLDVTVDGRNNVWLAGAGGGVGVFNSKGIILSMNDDERPSTISLDIDVYPTLGVKDRITIRANEYLNAQLEWYDLHGKLLDRSEITLEGNVVQQISIPQSIPKTILMKVSSEEGTKTVKLIR